MSVPTYPAYRDSGVEWIGKVPAHWCVDRLKASIVTCQNGVWGDEPQGNDDDVACVRVADFDRQRLRVVLDEPTIRNIPERDRRTRQILSGDLLIEKSGGGEHQPVGTVVLYDHARLAVCSNFVARVQLATDMDPSFWRYVHSAAYAIRLTVASIKQTSGIQNLDHAAYFNERAAFPPSAEQSAIAAFLERETGKIDALVAEQERLIALLKEKRQSVVYGAMTNGVEPAARTKPSGVGTPACVPEHWEVLPLTRVVRQFVDYRGSTPNKIDDGIPLITATQIKEGRIDHALDPVFISEAEYASRMTRGFPARGDVLLTTEAPLGEVAQIEDTQVAPGQRMILLKADDAKIRSDFLFWHFRSDFGRKELWTRASGSTASGIRSDRLRASAVLVPPLDEQDRIVAFISDALAKFAGVEAEVRRQISLLQERRAALISNAVTGKIDVRGIEPEVQEAA